MSKSYINKILETNTDENISKEIPREDPNELFKFIIDFTNDSYIREKALNYCFEHYGAELCLEVLNKLSGMYQFSGSTVIQNFLYNLCINNKIINSFLRLNCAKSLLSFEEFLEDINSDDEEEFKNIKKESNNKIKERNTKRKNKGYKALKYVCEDFDDVATPCKVDALILLLKSSYSKEAVKQLKRIVNDSHINCDYRYKIILRLENIEIDNINNVLEELLVSFIKKRLNDVRYKILACQYVLQNLSLKDNSFIENTLFSIAEDKKLINDIRADAADTLLSLSKDENKIKAENILKQLGCKNSLNNSLYENSQNVHCKTIEKSLLETLDKLIQIPIIKINDKKIDYKYVNDFIINSLKEHDEEYKEKIMHSLNRINIDRILYSKHNITLKNILIKIYSYIYDHEHYTELIKRLKQELYDMSNTCSTGFSSRLLNVLSGYDDFNIKISFQDQIVSNFIARFNSRILNIVSEKSKYYKEYHDIVWLFLKENHFEFIESSSLKTKDEIIEEYLKTDKQTKIRTAVDDFMNSITLELLETNKYSNRLHFIKFFRDTMSQIRQELYEEFKDYISDEEFDYSIRKAIDNYE